jgi:peptidoglycan/LPS O-acetylase OafA/YrhL
LRVPCDNKKRQEIGHIGETSTANFSPATRLGAVGEGGRTVNTRYRADVDGLRAVAVCLVIAFHSFPSVAPGGFTGVDVFFMISGFLITSILESDLQGSRFSIIRFYSNRIRRIAPALIIVILSVLLFGWLLLMPDEFQMVCDQAFASTHYRG